MRLARLPRAAFLAVALAGCGAPGAVRHPAGGFVERGELGTYGAGGGSAVEVASLAHGAGGGREWVVIAFADSSGFPARTVGASRAELLRDLGIVRVWLPPRVIGTALPDRAFGTTLVEHAYVVRSLDGGLFVDVHLGTVASRARLAFGSRPAIVAIELEPGGTALPPPAAAGPGVAVVVPRAGALDYPLAVEGYARPGDSTLRVTLRRGDAALRDTTVEPKADAAAWGEFRAALGAGPRDSLELFVAAPAAEGAATGAIVPIRMR